MLSPKMRQISYYLLFICVFLTNILAQTTIILEEDFESGWNDWESYVDWNATAESWIMNEGGSKVMHTYISDEGSESWHVHLRKDGLQLQNGKTYKFTFDAYCESGWSRYINVTLEKSEDPYTNFSNADPFLINGTKQTFEYSFVMTAPTENAAGFCIEMGYFEGTNDPIDVVVDNIKIEEMDGQSHTVTIESPANGTITNQTSIFIAWSVDGVSQTTDLSEDLTEGNNTITRTYTDSYGNVFSASIDVTLDTQAPVVAISSPVDGYITNQSSISVDWSVDGVAQTTQLTENLSEGLNTITRSFTDAAGNVGTASINVTLDTQAPVVAINSPADGDVFDITPISVAWTVDGVNQTTQLSEGLIEGSNTISRSFTDAAGNVGSASISVTYNSIVLPPDPVTVAPALDSTTITDMKTATEFLYTGSNPIQTGVSTGTIEAKRVAVIKGKVLSVDDNPLSGVVISVFDHPEFGQTISRADGEYDLAVNGGGILTVKYEKEGYFKAQRQVDAPWRDYVRADNVVLIQPDSVVTPISMINNTTMQVAQGSVITDNDGERQATILFPSGIEATNLSMQTLNVRATEYTVGDNGLEAMPANIPNQIGYTYCVELSVDGAEDVTFNKPVYFYVDNFLNFPVGGIVPTGYYDKEKAAWIPSKNGRVVSILSVTGGVASLDVDGSGNPADAQTLADLGVEQEELENIASIYAAGETLWRVPMQHFTPWDCNWPYGPPSDATPPEVPEVKTEENFSNSCSINGWSTIDIQNQILGEVVDVTGTPFSLFYSSDRMVGRTSKQRIQIPLSSDVLPAGLKRIDLEIGIAGRVLKHRFTPFENLSYEFIWDGKDSYGRFVNSSQKAEIKIGYVYDAVYMEPGEEFENSFGQLSGEVLSANEAREEVTIWNIQYATIRKAGNIYKSINEWAIGQHHSFDRENQILFMGNGTSRELLGQPINVIAGTGESGFNGDGLLAKMSLLNSPNDVAINDAGEVIFIDSDNNRIRKIDNDGIISTIAGNGIDGWDDLDGKVATEVSLKDPCALSIDNYGDIYFAELDRHHISKIGKDGVITTLVSEMSGYSGDNGPAKDARISYVRGISFNNNNELFFSDMVNYVIRKIDNAGIITTISGTGEYGFDGDNGPAKDAVLGRPTDIDIDIDGNIYFIDEGNNRIRKISTDGIITTIAGGAASGSGFTEGAPATTIDIRACRKIALDNYGNILFGEISYARIFSVDQNGILNIFAGNGSYESSGDHGNPLQASFSGINGLTVSSDNEVYICDANANLIRKIGSTIEGFSLSDILIASENGALIYHFNSNGKHLRTLDAITKSTIYEFNYNAAGLLESIEDKDGQITTIERDLNGVATAIVAPHGQRTTLSVDVNGYLNQITNPAGESVRATYTNDGLMTSFTNGRNYTSILTYDALGRLIKDENSEGGYTAIERTEHENGYEIKKTQNATDTKVYETTYRIETLTTGDVKQTTSGCCGGPVELLIGRDGSNTITSPDGTVTTITKKPDPRFGMQSPLKDKKIVYPSGKVEEIISKRSVVLGDYTDIFSLMSVTDSVIANGDVYTTVYDSVTKVFTHTTPEGKISRSTINNKGRIINSEVTGIEPVSYSYDTEGRLTTISQGTGSDERVSSIAYNTNGYVENVTNSMNQVTSYEYDLAGRVTKTILPDLSEVGYSYDANSNITGITPPGKDEHVFNYTEADELDNYNPPALASGATLTQYTYNLNKQLTAINRPDGQNVTFAYDDIGRVLDVTTPTGTIGYVYNDTTNQLTDIATAGQNINYSYDGSLLTKASYSGAVAGDIEFAYNTKLQVDTIKVNGANPVVVEYDNDGAVTDIGALAITDDVENGRLTGTRIGNIRDTLLFNNFSELSSYEVYNSGVEFFKTEITAVDKLGRITGKTETFNGESHSFTYGYDNVGQLVSVLKDGNPYSTYSYDSNGNRLSFTGASSSASGTYDEQDRMLSYGNYTYQYSDNGELQSKTNGVETTNYTYDVFGNLLSVSLPNGTLIEYVIDGNDRRIGKKVNGSMVKGFLYQSPLRPIAELDNLGGIVSRFVYGTRINVPDYMEKGGITYKLVTDYLGSVRAVVDITSGQVAQQIDYDEFGRVLFDSNPGFQPFGYAGGLYDHETGFVRFGARDYDAESGRWASKDPIRFSGGDGNLYGYSFNNPVNYNDPNGKFVLADDAAILSFIALTALTLYAVHVYNDFKGKEFSFWEDNVYLNEDDSDTDEGDKDDGEGCDGKDERDRQKGDRIKSGDDANQQYDEITKAQDNAKKNRPSIQDQESDWEGVKRRPKQNKINSTSKSKRRKFW